MLAGRRGLTAFQCQNPLLTQEKGRAQAMARHVLSPPTETDHYKSEISKLFLLDADVAGHISPGPANHQESTGGMGDTILSRQSTCDS